MSAASPSGRAPSKRGLAPDYPRHRREIPCLSINCYTGGVAHVLGQQGHVVTESQIWSLGEGYHLISGFDEYDLPELRFEMFAVVDRFCAKAGVELVRTPIELDRLVDQLVELTGRGSGIMAWVNSKFLRYSDLNYSSAGYLHSVVLEGLGATEDAVRLTDTLIVTLPPKACEADLGLDDLRGALTVPVSEVIATYSKDYVGVRGAPRNLDDPAVVRASLLSNARRIVAAHASGSPILEYGARCERSIAELDGEELSAYLRRINDNINTLYVMPSRNLALRSLGEALGPIDAIEPLKQATAAMILSWKTVSNLTLKASITRSRTDLARFPACIEQAERDEKGFWTTVVAELEAKQPS